MLPEDMEFSDLPQVIDEGRITIESEIGRGGGGMVVQAIHRDRGACAVKFRPVTENKMMAARFLVEWVPMERISHDRVVDVWGVGQDAGYYWIAMKFYPKGSLYHHVRRDGVLPLEEALLRAHEILDGLLALHDAGFVHRDIKAQNIFLDADGTSVIGDFGVVKHLDGKVPFRTMTGQSIGTQGFRAPEQDRDASTADLRADIYGVGSTLYYSLTGRRPGFLYMAEVQPDLLEPLPPEVRELVGKATRHEPVERYQSASEMAVAVSELYQSLFRARGEAAPTLALTHVTPTPPETLPDTIPTPPPQPTRQAEVDAGVMGWVRRLFGS